MNKTHSRNATATAFILLALGFIAPHAGAVLNCTPEPAGPPGPPGPAAVWSIHILPRGDLAMGREELRGLYGRRIRCRSLARRLAPADNSPAF
jgi:hypothetical protein